jgi:hypothetical protein
MILFTGRWRQQMKVRIMGAMKERKRTELDTRVEVGQFNRAYRLLSKRFASPFRETYLRGKTQFRDFLYEKMGCSLLDAELLVDALEKSGKIEFRRFSKGMRYGEWEIHTIP